MNTAGKIGLAAGALGAYLAAPAAIGGLTYHFAFKRNGIQTSKKVYDIIGRVQKSRSAKKQTETGPKEETKAPPVNIYREAANWFIKADRENAFLQSGIDNKKIHAYVIEQPEKSDKWLYTMHGFTGSPIDMALVAKEFYEKGYNILAVSMRGHALSSDDRNSMGYLDAKDAVQWTDYILEKTPDAKIVMHGMSMGAAACMMSLGENLPDNVKCAIEDCGFARCQEQNIGVAEQFIGKPARLFGMYLNGVMKALRGYDMTDINPINCVRASKVPIFFIHGEKDEVVPVKNVYELYEACPTPKELLVVPGAKHTMASVNGYEDYFGKAFEFVGKYI